MLERWLVVVVYKMVSLVCNQTIDIETDQHRSVKPL